MDLPGHGQRSAHPSTVPPLPRSPLTDHMHPRTPPRMAKNACGFTLVVCEEASKPCTTSHGASPCHVVADSRQEQHVALAWGIALVMSMLHLRVEGLP